MDESKSSSGKSDCEKQISEKNIWDSAHILTRRAAFYSKIEEYYQEGTYTDVNVHCQDQVFRCHRLALAAASEYFHHMFRGNFSESHKQDVTLGDIDSVTFSQILLFVYTGEIAAITDDNVYNLLRASNILKLSDVEDHCVHYLTQKNIPMNCALEIYLFATAGFQVSLIPAASRFILKHLDRFSQDTNFLRMSLEDFSTLLTYFQASSVSREARLLDAIFEWVCNSTAVFEERRSSFRKLAQKVEFKTISAAHVEEYIEKNSVEGNVESHRGEVSLAMDICSAMKNDDLSLYVYIGTAGVKRNRRYWDRLDSGVEQTSIFSLQETGRKGVDWHFTHTISPAIKKMRIVESDGRLYSLKLWDERWTFSSSTAIDLTADLQFLAPPSSLALMSPTVFTEFDYGCASFPLCRLRKNIYLSDLHTNVGFQCYNTELGVWSPIPVLSEYKPDNLMNDDTRLYMIINRSYSSPSLFAAYDPRIGKVEELSNEGLRSIRSCSESASYYNGRLYLPEDHSGEEYVSKFKMAIYDPAAGRWDVQNLKSHYVSYTSGHRLVSFNDRLWMFGLQGGEIYTQTYDSYLQKWNDEHSNSLDKALSNVKLESVKLTDVIAFKSS